MEYAFRAEQSRAERNSYIDFLRGIAALGIIAIHTAFWAGQSYTPAWFWNITLLLDVPFFFYLSGWASSYKKCELKHVVKSLFIIWNKWIFFVSLVAIFCAFSRKLPIHFEGVVDLRDLINNYMYNVSIPGFCVVAGSIWFMQYYFVIVLVNSIVMILFQKSNKIFEYKRLYMWMLIASFVWVHYGKYALGLDLTYFLFYSIFWMLGMNRKGKNKTLLSLMLTIALIAGAVCFASYLQQLPLYDLQSAKFPPTLKYGFASLFAVVIAKFFDGKYNRRCKMLEHIGRNAIYYYFGQGIGSSINFLVVERISIHSWLLKWIITYAINVCMTIIIAESIAWLYKAAEHRLVAAYVKSRI